MRNLLNFLLKYNYWFLFILLEVASFVLLFRFNRYQQSAFFTSANTVVGAVYEVSGGISSYFHLKSVNEDLLDRNMVLEQQITNLEKALREQQLDSMAINSIRQVPQADYQLFKAHVIKNSLNLVDNYITLDKGSSSGIRSEMVGVLMGILQAAFKDKVFDWIGTAYTVFVNAVPSLVSYSLVLVFGSKYLGFPTLYSTRNVSASSVLPITCLSLASIAGYALWTRRYMVDELTRDYIKLARVKGLSSREIMFKHVLRNAMVPMVQYIPQSILLTVGGSLLMERFFSVPGMGPLLTDAIQRYDLNVVQTLVILYAALGIVGVFLGDVLMMLVDPRITLTGKEAAR